MTYLAVDPGIDTGWAHFSAGTKLLACGLGDPCEVGLPDFDVDARIQRVIIEKPQVYRASMSKGDPNDLITLGVRVGEYKRCFQHERGASVRLVLPCDWKGQQPKDVTELRARQSLSPPEMSIVAACMKSVAPSKRHNVWDAIALGRAAFEKKLWA